MFRDSDSSMTMVVTSCSKRKRFAPPLHLNACSLPYGALAAVARDWERRTAMAVPVAKAGQLYAGRQFQEVCQAGQALDAEMLIISAGLGVVRQDELVPAYGLTVAASGDDSVLARIEGKASSSDWWKAITASASHRFRSLNFALSGASTGVVLLALPSAYLTMVTDELAAFAPALRNRLRVFTCPSFSFEDEGLDRLIMPYDDRLDGPDSPRPGAGTDFSGRALADFANAILPELPGADAAEHAAAVSRRLSGWSAKHRPERLKCGDAELIEITRKHWTKAGASASRLLRFMRDDLGVACGQDRAHRIWAIVRADQEDAA